MPDHTPTSLPEPTVAPWPADQLTRVPYWAFQREDVLALEADVVAMTVYLVAPKAGETVFKKCTACHNLAKPPKNGIGPSLVGSSRKNT